MEHTTTNKIRELYKEAEIDHKNSQASINQTWSLLASGGLNSALIYTGTRPTPAIIDGILVTRPNINKRVYACIYLMYDDLYNIDFVQIGKDKGKIIKHESDIYLDMLAKAYERIYDEYINDVQDGIFI